MICGNCKHYEEGEFWCLLYEHVVCDKARACGHYEAKEVIE